MSEYQTTRILCAELSCNESFANHKWGAIKAHDEGWFALKEGEAWCPQHLPDWVEKFRKDGK